jgi:hypothetical protein
MALTPNSRLANPHFLAAAGILAVTAVIAGPVARHYGAVVKEPVPLRSPLHELEKSALGPYRFVQAQTLEADELNTLGTDQYISWELEDTSLAEPSDPLRFVQLFVTYYTGKPDMVPHIPDVCRVGAGYEVKERADVEVEVPSLGARVPMRMVSFTRSQMYQQDTPTVIYTFHANGEFTCSREGVRLRTGSITERRAYFSKIEIAFGSTLSRPQNPTPAQTLDGARKLLDRVLPLLLNRHFPDWENLRRNHASETTQASGAERPQPRAPNAG